MNKTFICIFSIVFLTMAGVFATFPRSTFSELERRELATVPEFSVDKLKDGTYAKEISEWFSDSEPFRDQLMTLSMGLKQHLALSLGNGEDDIVFHASDQQDSNEENQEVADDDNRNIADFDGGDLADENAKLATAGIIIVGSGPNVRALNAYGGDANGGVSYAETANAYQEAFGGKVQVYCMVIPTSTEFYLPEKAKKLSRPQLPTIRNIYSHLLPQVKAVDCYTPLSQHVKEDIYLRTDHHWAPLGAFYAAQKFAQVAKVPFKDLSNYDKVVVHGYVGSMYGYSHDIAVKNAPEDFVSYEPRGVQYTTTYITYTLSKGFNITHESAPAKGEFFFHFKDGSTAAYCTFMGGDTKITQVRTSTKNGRRLIILKDSFGNALPGYLFFSFEEIHVIDTRYFTKNMKQYVEANKITDILFANNIYKAYSGGSAKACMRFLTQSSAQLNTPSESVNTEKKKEKPKEKEKATPKEQEKTETPKHETTETPQEPTE